jgi:hypothetical protein
VPCKVLDNLHRNGGCTSVTLPPEAPLDAELMSEKCLLVP